MTSDPFVMGADREELAAFLGSYHESGPLLSPSAIADLTALAESVSADDSEVLTRQYAPANVFYFLVEGQVRFQIQLEEGNEDLDVGTSRTAWTPIGWSGFRSPGRYATTVVCVGPCRLLRFDHTALREHFSQHPDTGTLFLQGVLHGSLNLLETMWERLTGPFGKSVSVSGGLNPEGEEEAYNRAAPALTDLLRRSGFFEVFDEAQLGTLSRDAESHYYCRGEPILRQGSKEIGLWMLATGRVALHHHPSGLGEEIALRVLSTPGAVIAWAGIAGVGTHATSVVATRDCTVYRLSPARLAEVFRGDSSLAFALTRRLLWIVSNHLRAARALFISRQFEHEILAIRNLLEQSCTQLSVGSPLHRLPHLLQSAYTLSDAFTCLAEVADSPDALERSLAQVCVDILAEVRREHEFFEALRRVYHTVVTAPPAMPSQEVRRLCARGFREAFRSVRYVVSGEEHLPQTSGHIFIFNHLKNHEYNTLPNNFQLTLDSHFVSSVILDPRYGDSGIRVVRKSRGTEYGHQDYYDRLGHISVYTKESDEPEETPAQRRARQNEFFEIAGQYLATGTNLIISPEGTSYWTEESPGPFKPGTFRLAASVEPEPWIVPIAVANFDRRVHSAVYAAVIKEPFRVSARVEDPRDADQLRVFLRKFQGLYAGYVAEARELAERGGTP